LHRHGDDILDLAGARAGKRDEHICERHIDLRLLLARRHEHGEETEQEPGEREQRSDLGVLETACDRAGEAEPPAAAVWAAVRAGGPAVRVHARCAGSAHSPWATSCRSLMKIPAATGSSATSSPSSSPASTSTSSPYVRPRRTCLSVTRSSLAT